MSAFDITVTGLVQGIGFLSFVKEYAEKNGLNGSVKNSGGVVKIFVECDEVEIGRLTYHLRYNCPDGARIENVIVKPVEEEVYDEASVQRSKELEEIAGRVDAAEKERDEYMESRGWVDRKESTDGDDSDIMSTEAQKGESASVDTATEDTEESESEAEDDSEVAEGVVLDEFGRELDDSFRIIKSDNYEEELRILPPDLPTCEKCEQELLDPNNRRYRYPFISCSQCGPRYSIMKAVPYDRENSTMASFTMCPDCAREYDEPGNIRRFDQNIGCPNCGPKLRYYENRLVDELQMTQDEMLDITVSNLKAGKIGAIKDMGGFHLAFIPTSDEAVRKVRAFKDRQSKPFAVMFPNIDEIKKYCYVSEKEEEVLRSSPRPIVLLDRREEADEFSDGICAGNDRLGAMLPANTLQIILTREVGPLVMTSGNKGGEPIIIEDMDMIKYLPRVGGSSMADTEMSAVSYADSSINKEQTTYIGSEEMNEDELFLDFMLTNTREILAPLDDSVVQVTKIHVGSRVKEIVQIIRRARGYVPEPIIIDEELRRQTFAAGTDYESSFALGKKNALYVSEYYGNITKPTVNEVRSKAIKRMEKLLAISPNRYIADMHPNYQTAKDADNRAMQVYLDGIPQRVIRRQHHAAHVLAVAAEYGLKGRVLGLSYDGTGYGLDDTIWGSEIFSCMLNETVDEEEAKSESTVEIRPKILRSGALLPVKLMGGSQTSRDVRTTLCGYIRAIEERQLVSGGTIDKVFRILGIDRGDYGIISACLKADIDTYYSACMGRLFDAVTALLGIRSRNTFGGESPIALEDAAVRAYKRRGEKLILQEDGQLTLRVIEPNDEKEIYRMDQTVLIADLMEKLVQIYDSGLDEKAREEAIEDLALEFHSAIIASTVHICDMVCARDYIHRIAISGGTMFNRLLMDGIAGSLEEMGYGVFVNSRISNGDGGISLGQLYGEVI